MSDNEPPFFDQVREQLRYWPYTIHQIDDTLDIELIEGKARQLLFQAMNAQNLIAFVGSGMSAAYGRPAWRAWQEEHLRIVETSATAFLTLTNAALAWNTWLTAKVSYPLTSGRDPDAAVRLSQPELSKLKNHRHAIWRWFRGQERALTNARLHVRALDETFKNCRTDSGSFVGGEPQPVLFEITNQLNDAVERYSAIFLDRTERHLTNVKAFEAAWAGAHLRANGGAVPWAAEALKQALGSTLAKESAALAYHAAFDAFRDAMLRPLAGNSLQDQAKRMLASECGHALQILRGGLLRGKDAEGSKAPEPRSTDGHASGLNAWREVERLLTFPDLPDLAREFPGIRDNPENYRVLGPFRIAFLETLLGKVEPETPKFSGIFDLIRAEFGLGDTSKTPRSGKAERFITPSLRFLVGALLALHPRPKSCLLVQGELRNDAFPPLAVTDFSSRRSILDAAQDPIDRAVRDLGINRFITTNYDFELERYFVDHGFHRFPRHGPTPLRDAPPFPGPLDFRTDGIGKSLHDQSFQRDKAAELTSFALGDRDDGAAVFHLHGRATRDERLVITERDYMDLYLQQDQWRASVDEAMTIAFASAPILFLGLGMTESDLLRPLRQFMSNRDRTLGYNAIALLPAEKSLAERTKVSSSLYLRYGVHAIFFGGGVVEFDVGAKRSIDWLHRIFQLIDVMAKHLAMLDGKTAEKPAPEDLLKTLNTTLGPITADLKGHIDGQTALRALFGLSGQGAPAVEEFLAATLKCVRFTPVRKNESNTASSHYSAETEIDGEPYVEFPTRLLDAALKQLLSQTAWEPREIAAVSLMLDGLRGAFLTGSLNAALDGLKRSHEAWWRNWQESPAHRLARLEQIDRVASTAQPVADKGGEAPKDGHEDSILGPVCFMRHRVDTVLGPSRKNWDKPVTEGPLLDDRQHKVADGQQTGVRSFDTFCAAIGSNRKPDTGALQDRGRVLFTVLAQRGLGKGTFVSAFSGQRGLTLYEAMLWRKYTRDSRLAGSERHAFLLGAAFLGLGFVTEIGSVYDMLLATLTDATAVLEAGNSASADDLRKMLADPTAAVRQKRTALADALATLPRLDAHREIMRRFRDASAGRADPEQARFLIVIGSAELLFTPNGTPKNAEIAAWLDLLLGPEAATYPFDLVFVASESGLGLPFSAQSGANGDLPHRIRLDRLGLNAEARVYLAERLQSGRVQLDTPGEPPKEMIGALVSGAKPPLVHGLTRSITNFVHVVRPFNPIGLLHDNFKLLATVFFLTDKDPGHRQTPKPDPDTIAPDTIARARVWSDKLTTRIWTQPWRAKFSSPSARNLSAARSSVWKKFAKELHRLTYHDGDHSDWFDRTIDTPLRTPLDATDTDTARAAYNQALRRVRQEWRDIRHYLGNNRYLLTILLAAAEHIVIHADDWKSGATRARRFITATVDLVRNSGSDRREETVLIAVLNAYESLHRIGHPDQDIELHQIILRHVGLIGAPVSVDVLVRLPEFRDYFDRLKEPLHYSRHRFLARALTVLAHRGLVFRLSPHPNLPSESSNSGMDWPAQENHRYVLHRIVQRYAVAKLGVKSLDSVAAGGFAPTLHAAIPSPGTGLTQQGYAFVRSLIIGLSQYPDIPQNDDRLRPWLFTTKDKNTRVQALRSALTLARSTLSLPVFAGLRDEITNGGDLPKRGYLDTYKVRLRWIIRLAWEISSARPDDGALHALYRDEIVWLYNELGVISLSQGTLTEALGFLRQADEFNASIEGRARRGPTYDRIDLNHAAVQIERGRLAAAMRRLDRVLSSPYPDALLTMIAKGYQCRLRHIGGQREGIEAQFEQIVPQLMQSQEHRAAALLMLYQARFVADSDLDTALALAERAAALAKAGGQYDLWHQIDISRVSMEARARNPGNAGEQSAGWLRRLQESELYGRRMGAWGLQVDALTAQSERMLAFGEATSAGNLVARAISIATRNRMLLSLNPALTLHGEILLNRRDRAGALWTARKSLRLASGTGNNLETVRAQSLIARIESDLSRTS